MKRYVLVAASIATVLLAVFAVVEWWGPAFLAHPTNLFVGGGWTAAAVSIALLAGDVLAPVPASVVMVLNGAVFGLLLGTLVSVVGTVLASSLGFALGRGGHDLVEEVTTPTERERAGDLVERWGAVAVVATRPVPILAETTAILAGTTRELSWGMFLLAAIVGTLPASFLYALAGAVAATFGNMVVVLAAVLLVAGAFWYAARWWEVNVTREPVGETGSEG